MKQGDMYILDRATGMSLTPSVRSMARAGLVQPDLVAATQPISRCHSLRKRPKTERHVELLADQPVICRIQFRRSHYGGYLTPPTVDKPWIQYPGYNGGSDWGGVAIDRVPGVISPTTTTCRIATSWCRAPRPTPWAFNRSTPGGMPTPRSPARAEAALRRIRRSRPPTPSASTRAGALPHRRALLAPPYGGIRAIDLDTGQTLWDGPLGTARHNGPFGIASGFPFNIGPPNNGGSVVTAGGLVFIAAATDNLFRAIDIRTGKTLWRMFCRPAAGQPDFV